MKRNSVIFIKQSLFDENAVLKKWALQFPRRKSHVSDKNHEESNLIILTSYFTLLYYVGIIPYRFVYKYKHELDGTKSWQIKSFILQKIICYIFVWLPYFFIYATDIVQTMNEFYSSKGANHRNYFFVINHLMAFGRDSYFLWIFLSRAEDIQALLNNATRSGLFSHTHFQASSDKLLQKLKRTQTKGLVLILSIYFLAIVISIGNYLFLHYHGSPMSLPKDIFHTKTKDAKKRYFITSISISSSLEIGLGAVEMYLRFVEHLMGFLPDFLYIGIIPITFWIAACNFNQLVKDVDCSYSSPSSDHSGELQALRKIMKKYVALKEFSDGTNSLWAVYSLASFLDNSIRIIFRLKYYSLNMNVLNLSNMLMCLILYWQALYFHAEVFRKIASFRIWLISKKAHGDLKHWFPDEEQFRMLLKELKSEPIGLGLSGCFSVNYGFVAQLLVFVTTLFVVCFE